MINNIKEKRQEKNLTQQKLATKAEMSISQLANIENGRSIPNVETALKIAKELNCIVEEIFSLDKKE